MCIFEDYGLRERAVRRRRRTQTSVKRVAVLRVRAAANCAVRRTAFNSHASANPAAGTISEKGRSRRRSVKNRRPFDCFKSAEGIRFSAVARPTPKSFHRGGFWRYLLAAQKVTYIIRILLGYSGRSLRGYACEHSRTTAGLRCGRLLPAQSCGLHYLRAADSLKPPEPFSPAAI